MQIQRISRESMMILLLAFAAFASVANSLQFTPILTGLATEFDRPESVVGQIASISSFVGTGVALLVAPLMHKRPMRFWLQVQCVVLVVAVAVMATASSFEMLAAARVITGLGGGAMLATCFTAASEIVGDPNSIGRAIAIVASGTTVATLVGLPLLALIREAAGWRWASASIAVPLVLVVIGTRWLPSAAPGSVSRPASSVASMRAVLERRATLFLLLTVVLLFITYFGWIVYFAAYVEQEFNGGAGLISLIFVVAGLAELTGNATVPSLQRRFGGFAMTLAGTIGMGFSLIGSGVVITTVVTLVAAVAVLNVGVSFVFVGSHALLLEIDADHRPAVMALASAATGIGAAIGSLLGGRLLAAFDDYDAMYRALGLIMMIAAGCVLAGRRVANRSA